MTLEPRHLDGNAIAGNLIDAFGREMTVARERCCGCGSIREVAELRTYVGGPGDVLRCPDCGIVLLVVMRVERRIRVSAPSMTWLEMPD